MYVVDWLVFAMSVFAMMLFLKLVHSGHGEDIFLR